MEKRMLLFATTYFPLVGGAEIAVKEITDRIPEMRFDLICAAIQPGLPRMERIGNVTVHRVGFGMAMDKFLLPVCGVVKALRLQRPDAVWSLMASFGGFAALAYTWVRPNTRLLLTLQEGDPLEHYARRAGPFTWLHRQIFRRAQQVQAISTFLAAWATQMGFRGTPRVIPNGVDVPRFSQGMTTAEREAMRVSFGFTADDVVLVTASRLVHKNAVDELVRAIALLPVHVKAFILGAGEQEQVLRALAVERGVAERVVFAGEVSQADLPARLQCADVFVRASRSEGLGIAFLEAMAVGLPVIATPVGGIPDFVVDGETGVFCRVDDAASIAQAVERIVHDAALRERLVQNGRALITTRYAWDGIAAQMRELLSSL